MAVAASCDTVRSSLWVANLSISLGFTNVTLVLKFVGIGLGGGGPKCVRDGKAEAGGKTGAGGAGVGCATVFAAVVSGVAVTLGMNGLEGIAGIG